MSDSKHVTMRYVTQGWRWQGGLLAGGNDLYEGFRGAELLLCSPQSLPY